MNGVIELAKRIRKDTGDGTLSESAVRNRCCLNAMLIVQEMGDDKEIRNSINNLATICDAANEKWWKDL